MPLSKYLVLGFLLCAGVFGLYAQQIDLTTDYQLTKVCGKGKLSRNSSAVTVIIFYAPQCPICIAQTKTISALQDSFKTRSVNIALVYPGNYYKKAFIRRFQRHYKVRTTAYLDKAKKLTDALSATITPQAFVLDGSGKVVYSGKIDNLFEAVGKRRQVITEHYLFDAIDQLLQGKPVLNPSSEAVGCIIN